MLRLILKLLLLISLFIQGTGTALGKQKAKSSDRNVLALVTAASKGDVAKVTDLLKKRVDVNGKAPRNATDLAGQTALMAAAGAGHADIVRILLKHDANVNVRHEVGGTALTGAAARGHLEVVKELLKAGADPNLVVIGRYASVTTALMFAMNPDNKDWLKIVDEMIAAGAQINPPAFLSPLRLIIDDNHRSMLQPFLERGADVNLRGADGSTFLMYAAQHGSPEMVSALLDAGADINLRNNNDETALMIAKKHSEESIWGQQIVQLLKQRGAIQ